MSTIGPDSQIEQLLGEYGLGANSWMADIVQSDTDRLLLALLLEERGQDIITAVDQAQEEYSDTETTAAYTTAEITGGSEWSDPIDLGFIASSIDLRVSSANAEVAFADPNQNEGIGVPYGTADSPIVGIPAETSKVWGRRDPAASSDTTVQLEAWQ